MLIDEFLPVYDVVERHQIDVHAPVEPVYAAVRTLDLSDSTMIRWLFRLRGLPALLISRRKPKKRLGLTLDGLLESGFVLLGERPPQELLLGLVGRFWTPSGDVQRLDMAEFRDFERPSYTKAVWNFYLAQRSDGLTRLVTETRVQCLDDVSRRRFRLYWLFIKPFSGLIRIEALRAIKRKVEKRQTAAQRH